MPRLVWREEETDVLVVGRGVAGLMAALAAAEAGARVVVAGIGNGASSWLQGVNVPLGHADPRDGPAALEADILREGHGESDPLLAQATALEAEAAFETLLRIGVDFAQDDGRFRQRHPSGSTYPRCCYVASAMWGPVALQALKTALRARPDVSLLRARFVRFLRDGEGVIGAVGRDERSDENLLVRTPRVILAAGGLGDLYGHSTYPADTYGASYAMAAVAGAKLSGMEFVQFEPLVGAAPETIRGFVIPTTLFGDGAFLVDARGRRFLLETRPQGEAGIGKEELVHAIARTALAGRALPSGAVWLDTTRVPRQVLEAYPWFWRFMTKHGIDPSRERIEIRPAAHTCLGGIVVDSGRRTTLPGLFAAGEAAGGVHGAGRLAGGSGTDVIVSGRRAGLSAAATTADAPDRETALAVAETFFSPNAEPDLPPERAQVMGAEARAILSRAAGIWRDGAGLSAGLRAIGRLADEAAGALASPASLRLRIQDRLRVSAMIIEAALARRESRGAHQRLDSHGTLAADHSVRPIRHHAEGSLVR